MDVKNNSKTSVDPPRGHYSNGGPAKVDNFDPEKASDEARKRLRQGESIDSDETNRYDDNNSRGSVGFLSLPCWKCLVLESESISYTSSWVHYREKYSIVVEHDHCGQP